MSTPLAPDDVEQQLRVILADDDHDGTANGVDAPAASSGATVHVQQRTSPAKPLQDADGAVPNSPTQGRAAGPRGDYALMSTPEEPDPDASPTALQADSVPAEGLLSSHSALARRFARWTATPLFKVLVAGAGFLCDAYDLFVINIVMVLLSFDEPSQTAGDRAMMASAVLVGSVIGQLTFGILADSIGRRKGFIATLTLLIVGAFMSALSFSTPTVSIFACLALWRFVLGVGIGGEYPLAATVSSEASVEAEGRGKRVAAVFSMQGLGAVLAPLVVLILLGMAGPGHISTVWRLALAVGALPGLAMIYFRIRMPESEAFVQAAARAAEEEERGVARGEQEERTPMRRMLDATKEKFVALGAHWRTLMATAGSWCIFDVVFYGNGLFSSTIMASWYERPILGGEDEDQLVHEYLIKVGYASLLLGLCALPGYWAGMLLIDRIGRKKLQLLGYTGMIVTYLLCALLLPMLRDNRAGFLFLYGLTFFWCNCGPNVTTFVVPSEAFPTNVRATAHGLSAAAGKLGAVAGGALMPALLDGGGEDGTPGESHLGRVMLACAFISLVGWLWTWWWSVETMHHSVVDAAPEEAEMSQLRAVGGGSGTRSSRANTDELGEGVHLDLRVDSAASALRADEAQEELELALREL